MDLLVVIKLYDGETKMRAIVIFSTNFSNNSAKSGVLSLTDPPQTGQGVVVSLHQHRGQSSVYRTVQVLLSQATRTVHP